MAYRQVICIYARYELKIFSKILKKIDPIYKFYTFTFDECNQQRFIFCNACQTVCQTRNKQSLFNNSLRQHLLCTSI